jgi:pimeloyl-ACP methyl ester carboxylesterase
MTLVCRIVATVFLGSLAVTATQLAAQIAPAVHWHNEEPLPQMGFRHVPIAVFGAVETSAADYAGLLQGLARDRWVLFLVPAGSASDERASMVGASLRAEAARRGFTSVDIIGADQGGSLALSIADADPKLVRRVLLLAASNGSSLASRSLARFSRLNASGRTTDDTAAKELVSEIKRVFDGCHCQKPAP